MTTLSQNEEIDRENKNKAIEKNKGPADCDSVGPEGLVRRG